MPILAVHGDEHPDPAKRNTLQHRCARCGHERFLVIDPARGDLVADAERRGLSTRPCPVCLETDVSPQTGEPLMVTESFTTSIPPWEAHEPLPASHPLAAAHPEWGGIWRHPGSLVGQTFDLGTKDAHGRPLRTVVIEHTEGYTLDSEEVEHRRRIRALLAHPHLAKHVPLDDTPHERMHAAYEKRARLRKEKDQGSQEAQRPR